MAGTFYNTELIDHLKKSLEIAKQFRKNIRKDCETDGVEVVTKKGIVKIAINNTSRNIEVYGFNLATYQNGEVGLIRITNRTLNKLVDVEKDIIVEQILTYATHTFSFSTGGVNENIAQSKQIEGFFSKRGYCNIQVPSNVKIEVEFYFKSIAKDYYKGLLESIVESNNEIIQILKDIP